MWENKPGDSDPENIGGTPATPTEIKSTKV
jgi:hypothetical protein